jgi:hypothetical protein
MLMQEQEIDTVANRSAVYLDYRPYIRQICQNEQTRAAESTSSRRYGFKNRHLSIRNSRYWQEETVDLVSGVYPYDV